MSLHDDLARGLATRLREGCRYAFVLEFVNYKEGRLAGEVDVLAFHEKSLTWHFYEVKSHYTRGQEEKALKQYARYVRAYPEREVKGVLYTSERVVRMRHG